jgi:hypothetical protein
MMNSGQRSALGHPAVTATIGSSAAFSALDNWPWRARRYKVAGGRYRRSERRLDGIVLATKAGPV